MIAEGSDRFEIQRRLGSGGMGLVYQAVDHQRGAQVALKTLRQLDATALLRFKNEFRALADVVHPNLVTLYELLALDDEWFFTMEFVEGVHFIDFVRPPRGQGSVSRDPGTMTTHEVGSTEPPTRPVGTPPLPGSGIKGTAHHGELDGALLRRVFPQVVEAVMALHQAGKLHRDLKPSNVLVTPSGRVVVCDFGLIADVKDPGPTQSDGSGTPAYMSPEQLDSAPLSEASDWYSVGIMLYEALTGRVPFRGDRQDMIQRKGQLPPRPRELGVEGMDDLETVCMALLEPRPADRWTGEAILFFLGGDRGSVPTVTPDAPFVGRRTELSRLEAAFRAVGPGPQVALVHASSGMGKSALVRHFLEARRAESVRVLSGRCFERESVPYRALDGVIDALTVHLQSLPRPEAEAILGDDWQALARLFPVLRRLGQGAEAAVPEAPDPHEARRKGWLAFRGVLRRLAERAPLIVAVDDVQWSDGDSARLIEQLIRPPAAPSVFWIFCARREDLDNPVVESLAGTAVHDVALDPLGPEEGSALAASLTGDGAVAANLALEGEGSPFLIQELARFQRQRRPDDSAPRSLEDMLRARVTEVTATAQDLLAVLAVAGRPVRWTTVQRALPSGDHPGSLATLRVHRLIKMHVHGGTEQVETYHDRIRESVAEDLGEARRREIHRRLALAFSPDVETDTEQLVEHWLGAGEREKARGYAVMAAQRAFEGLAFEQAAKRARQAIELGAGEGPESVPLWRLLGLALSNGGRGAAAADAFLTGAGRAGDGREALDLRHLAGEQLLRIGELEKGRAMMGEVLKALGLRAPPTPRRALWSLLKGRVRVLVRGLSYRLRPTEEIPPEELKRIDLCFSIALGLAFTETIRGADYQTQCLLMALDAGEPKRIARALTLEASFLSVEGQPTEARVQMLLAEAERLAMRLDEPYVTAILIGSRGLTRLMRGEWRPAIEDFEVTITILRDRCTGAAFEFSNMVQYLLIMLFYLGRFRELSERVPGALSEAIDRGDAYLETCIRCRAAHLVALIADDPVAARQHAEESGRRWKMPGFQLQHHYQMVAESEVDLYEGRGEAARRRVVATWPKLRRSFLLRMQIIRVLALWLRAGGAVTEARRNGPRAPALRREGLRLARRIEREGEGYIRAKACLIRAAVADQNGDIPGALALLAEAIRRLHEVQMEGHAAGAELLWGRLAGGEEGARRVAGALAWFEREGVKAPDRMIRVLCPGWS